MRTGDFFKSSVLKSTDFPEPKVVVLADVGTKSFRDSPEPKPVVYFKGVQKPLILNKTMAQFLEDASGTDVMTDWAGTKVENFRHFRRGQRSDKALPSSSCTGSSRTADKPSNQAVRAARQPRRHGR